MNVIIKAVGEPGSGKSSLLRLLSEFIESLGIKVYVSSRPEEENEFGVHTADLLRFIRSDKSPMHENMRRGLEAAHELISTGPKKGTWGEEATSWLRQYNQEFPKEPVMRTGGNMWNRSQWRAHAEKLQKSLDNKAVELARLQLTVNQLADGLRSAYTLFRLCEYHFRSNHKMMGALAQINNWFRDYHKHADKITGVQAWKVDANATFGATDSPLHYQSIGRGTRIVDNKDNHYMRVADMLERGDISRDTYNQFMMGTWDLTEYEWKLNPKLEAEMFLWGRKLTDPISDLDIHKLSSDAWQIVRETTDTYTGVHHHTWERIESRGQWLQCKCGVHQSLGRIARNGCDQTIPYLGDWSWCSTPGNPEGAAAFGRFLAERANYGIFEPLKG